MLKNWMCKLSMFSQIRSHTYIATINSLLRPSTACINTAIKIYTATVNES